MCKMRVSEQLDGTKGTPGIIKTDLLDSSLAADPSPSGDEKNLPSQPRRSQGVTFIPLVPESAVPGIGAAQASITHSCGGIQQKAMWSSMSNSTDIKINSTSVHLHKRVTRLK